MKLRRANERYTQSLNKIKKLKEQLKKNSQANNVIKILGDAQNGDPKAILLADTIKNYTKKASDGQK